MIVDVKLKYGPQRNHIYIHIGAWGRRAMEDTIGLPTLPKHRKGQQDQSKHQVAKLYRIFVEGMKKLDFKEKMS